MIEVIGNLWTYPARYRIITTNGSITKDGLAVMGRGVAKQATYKFPLLQRDLGRKLTQFGNNVHIFANIRIITFPVKHRWFENADINLIARSVDQLLIELNNVPQDIIFVMPRPGCGNGKLKWEDVKSYMICLPNNVHIINLKANAQQS